ncbi:phage tail protein [Kitasatospora sp. NPDC052896]|uniref:phage tail protein n=1 Tax=Kitasatospora sp. NPDC052896 TaxID=3364061 RepID=UPI0037C9080B
MVNSTTSQQPSFSHVQTDPLRNFKFQAFIHYSDLDDRTPQMGFMSISGLSITTDVVVYRQGGMNTTTQKMPGQSDFAPITLSRGLICGDSDIFGWVQQIFMVQQGSGGSTGRDEFRANIDIYLLDHPVTSQTVTYKAGWRIYNAWPTSLAFGDLDAGANGVELQQITLAHEGWDFRIASTYGPDGTIQPFQ